MQEKTEQTRFKVIIDAPHAEVSAHIDKVSHSKLLGKVTVEVPEPSDSEIHDIKINKDQTIVIFDFGDFNHDPKKFLLYYVFLFVTLGEFPKPTKAILPELIKLGDDEFCIVNNPAEMTLLQFSYQVGFSEPGLQFPYVVFSRGGFEALRSLYFRPAYYDIRQWVQYLERQISTANTTLQTFKDKMKIK